MEKANEDIVVTIILASILIVVLAVFTMLFFLVFIRKKRLLQKKREEMSIHYENALLKTRIEIQDQTLHHISREIHDNIGQVLSFVKLSLGTAALLEDQEKQLKIEESVFLVSEVISELRDLSKSLSFDRIKKEGLYEVIKEEAERVNRSGMMSAFVSLTGTPFSLDSQRELLLFRIFQELTNNALKHSNSPVLMINLNYSSNLFILTLRDKGIGFDIANLEKFKGLGLDNIRQRAALIGALILIESSVGAGCFTEISLDLSK